MCVVHCAQLFHLGISSIYTWLQDIAEQEDIMDALGLNEADVRWSLGHALSRSFGAGVSPIMVPVVDLANHNASTVPPLTCASTVT